MKFEEIFKQARVYAKDVVDYLEPGMLVRIATTEELNEDNKRRQTSAWSSEHERVICYEEDDKKRIFTLTENAIEYFKSEYNIPLRILGTVPNHGGWNQYTYEVIVLTKTTDITRTLYQLIRVEPTTDKLNIEHVLISSNLEMIQKLKALNEKALKGTEKEATVEYRILQIPISSTKRDFARATDK